MPRKKKKSIKYITPAPSFTEYEEKMINYQETAARFNVKKLKLRQWKPKPTYDHLSRLYTWGCRKKVSDSCKLTIEDRMTLDQLKRLDNGNHHKLHLKQHLKQQQKNIYKKQTKFIFKENDNVKDDKGKEYKDMIYIHG
eukprot:115308_1